MEFKYFSELERLFRDEITHQHAAELGVELQDANADLPIDELDKLYEEYMKDADLWVSGLHSS
jgi:predicted acetyltransferase